MAAWKTSSLAFSDVSSGKHKRGLLKTRISKQHLVEHKVFGSKRKGIQIGKKFHGVGKGIMRKPTSAKMAGDMKSSGISPSLEEFDDMMDSIVNKKSKNGKAMFSRKQFG